MGTESIFFTAQKLPLNLPKKYEKRENYLEINSFD